MTAQKKKRASKRNKKMTLREFRAWLQGVEELQPDDWCPDRDQWKKIRDKIDNIIEEEPQPQAVTPSAPAVTNNAQPSQPNADEGAALPPPAESVPVAPTGPPMMGSGLEDAAALAPTKQPGPQVDSMTMGGAPGTSDSPRIRTPDIDTSDGSYGSSFE